MLNLDVRDEAPAPRRRQPVFAPDKPAYRAAIRVNWTPSTSMFSWDALPRGCCNTWRSTTPPRCGAASEAGSRTMNPALPPSEWWPQKSHCVLASQDFSHLRKSNPTSRKSSTYTNKPIFTLIQDKWLREKTQRTQHCPAPISAGRN